MKKLVMVVGVVVFSCHADPYILTAEPQAMPEQIPAEQPTFGVPKQFDRPSRFVLEKELQDANAAFDNFVQANRDVRDLWEQMQPLEEQMKALRIQMSSLGEVGKKFICLKKNIECAQRKVNDLAF